MKNKNPKLSISSIANKQASTLKNSELEKKDKIKNIFCRKR